MPIQTELFSDFGIGAVFVLIAAASRFNTPPTNRCTTTALRYFVAGTCYVLVELGLYCLLLYGAPYLAIELGFFKAALPEKLAAPPLAALLLTVLLPKVPLLSDADAWVLETLKRMAAIPFEARRLAAELRRSRFVVPPRLREQVSARLATMGFRHDEALLDAGLEGDEQGTSLEQVWLRIATLMIQLEEWESRRKLTGFLARYQEDLRALRTKAARLVPAFHALRGMPPAPPAGRRDRLAHYVHAELKQGSADLLVEICNFISRGLLQTFATYGARVSELRSLGFDCQAIALKPRVSLDQLITLFLAIEGTLIAGNVLAGHQFLQIGPGSLLAYVTMAATMYTVAALCAVYPKERWRFASRNGPGRPSSFYVVAGLCAVAASLAIRFVFLLLILHDLGKALLHFRLYSPWSLCAFVAGFMTAWMLDDAPLSWLPSSRLRWCEGILGAVTLLFASFIALEWTDSLAQGNMLLNADYHRPSPTVALGLSTAIGFGIGFLVPTWYRAASAEARPEPAPAGELFADAAG